MNKHKSHTKIKASGLNARKVKRIFDRLEALYPAAHCELEHKSPFELLIATILSAQCTDKRVNMVTPALFEVASSPEKMLQLGEVGLSSYIQSCGLYQSKAKNIIATCRLLLEKYDGAIPPSRAELVQLPGVGRKTANVVLYNAFAIPTIAVDTHVFRVSRRIGLAQGQNVNTVEKELMANIPKKRWGEAHHLMIFHGRYCFTARAPQCSRCPITRDCAYFQVQQ